MSLQDAINQGRAEFHSSMKAIAEKHGTALASLGMLAYQCAAMTRMLVRHGVPRHVTETLDDLHAVMLKALCEAAEVDPGAVTKIADGILEQAELLRAGVIEESRTQHTNEGNRNG